MEYIAALGMLVITAIAALIGRWTHLSTRTIGGVLGVVPAAFVGWLMMLNYVPYVISALMAAAAFAVVAGLACGGAAAGRSHRNHGKRIG